jgi:hypothetical protein
MARKKEVVNPEHEQLIEILKFTPRTYKIQMWGYGGEKVMGTVDKEVWDYCMENQVDLSEVAWGDEDMVVDELNLDLDKLPFPPGSWYECDNLMHCNGVSRDAGTLQIEDENGNEVYSESIEDLTGIGNSPEIECSDEEYVNGQPEGTVVFIGSSNEKGTFFEGEINLKAPFDITKLKLFYEDVDGEEIINHVEYDGEEIENWGGSTDGKSSDIYMYLVGADGEVERYEPEEKDWGHPPMGTGPSEWERSPKFNFKEVKPTIPGWYSAVWSSWGTSYGTLYWNGTEFGEWEHGNFKPVKQVESWSGYNWDTSDWANQPKEPVDTKCSNKKCGWVGKRDEMIEDDNYDSHCPECNGTNWEWIDYDPDTAKGRKNREKYVTITQTKQGETP